VDVGEDDVINVVRLHAERGQFLKQRATDAEPASDGRVDGTDARVDQCQARRRADQEAMVEEAPHVGGELVGIRRSEGPWSARKRVAAAIEHLGERVHRVDVEDRGDLHVPDGQRRSRHRRTLPVPCVAAAGATT
jgi:hypothetical protein